MVLGVRMGVLGVDTSIVVVRPLSFLVEECCCGTGVRFLEDGRLALAMGVLIAA